LVLVTGAAGIGFALVALHRFPGAGRDDVYLSLWAGKTLGQGLWFIDYNYRYGEISSSILHALIIKALSILFPDQLYAANKLFGLSCATLTVVLPLWWLRGRVWSSQFGAIVGAVFLTATSPVFQYWAIGGLETPIQALLLLTYVGIATAFFQKPSAHRARLLSRLTCLYIITRPEGFYLIPVPWVLAVLFGDSLVPRIRRLILRGTVLEVFLFAAVAAIRFAFTGLLFPNPVYAKVSVSFGALVTGIRYLHAYYGAGVIGAFHFLASLWSLGVAGWAIAQRLRRNVVAPHWIPHLVPAVLILLLDSFILVVGGDWMEYFRFVAPSVPVRNLMGMLGLFALGRVASPRFLPGSPVMRRALPFAVFFTLVPYLAWSQRLLDGYNTLWRAGNCSRELPLRQVFSTDNLSLLFLSVNCTYTRDLAGIAPFIRNELPHYLRRSGALRIVTYQMGFFPTRIRESYPNAPIEFIDVAGLADSAVATAAGERSFVGLKAYRDIAGILAGGFGHLSEQIQRRRPNMVYVMNADEATVKKLAALRFHVVWKHPYAVVFWRKPGNVRSEENSPWKG